MTTTRKTKIGQVTAGRLISTWLQGLHTVKSTVVDTSFIATNVSSKNAKASKPNVDKYPVKDVFAIKDGDIFKLSKLLELSGGLDLDRTFNNYGEPLRESGTVIEIEVIYQNLKAIWSTFGGSEVTYTYKFNQRPLEEMKTELFNQAQPLFPGKPARHLYHH